MGPKVHFDPLGCILLAAALLVLPLRWLLSAVIAAAFHEACHLLTAEALGIPVRDFQLRLGGCEIHTGVIKPWQELICAAAGPLGSLFLIHTISITPRLAICAGIQGLYNLLPVYPLDGGRIVYCILTLLAGESWAERIRPWVAGGVCLASILLGLWGTFFLDLGLIPLFFAGSLFLRLANTKKTLQTDPTRCTIDLTFTKR